MNLHSSEDFILKPKYFAHFAPTTDEIQFKLVQETDQRNRFYKIAINKNGIAELFEKSDGVPDWCSVNVPSSNVFNSYNFKSGRIEREIVINFSGNKYFPTTFRIRINGSESYFERSNTSVWFHTEVGSVDVIKSVVLNQSNIKELRRNEVYGYIFGAIDQNISENDVSVIKESISASMEWNKNTSSLVRILNQIVSGKNFSGKILSDSKQICENNYKLVDKFRELSLKVNDFGIKNFLAKIKELNYNIASNYSDAFEALESGNIERYSDKAETLKTLARIKLNDAGHFLERLRSIDKNSVDNYLKDFFTANGIPVQWFKGKILFQIIVI